jgi:hypothetical protein
LNIFLVSLIFLASFLASNFLEISSSGFSENSCGVDDDDNNDDEAVYLMSSFSSEDDEDDGDEEDIQKSLADGFIGGRWICGLFSLLLDVPVLDKDVKVGNGVGGQVHLLVTVPPVHQA